jgi:hypothetical protein
MMIPFRAIDLELSRGGGTCCVFALCLALVTAAGEARASTPSALIALCPAAVEGSRLDVVVSAPAGETLALVEAGAPGLERCRTVPLGVGAERVRWLGVLATDEARSARRIVLTVRDDRKKTTTAEVERSPAPVTARRLMPRKELFPLDASRLFGEGERARVQEAPTHVDLFCTSGDSPAGAVFKLGIPSRGAALAVELEAEGDAGFHAQVTAQDETATGAGVPLAGTRGLSARLPVPAADAVALVVSCPPEGGRIRLTRGTVKSARVPDFGRPAAWVWAPERWRDQPQDLLAAAKKLGIGTLLITVPIDGAGVAEPARLAEFVARARSQSIAVAAVEGDPNMVTDSGRAEALARARALAAYQAAAGEGGRLAGVQYDIEPYFLPGFALDPAAAWRAWAESLAQLAAAFGAPVDVAVPYWMMESPGGADALSALRPRLRRVTIMAYRTAPDAIVAAAEPILAWAVTTGLPVDVGLESGPLPAERRDTFIAADVGELHVIPLGQLAAVVLLDGADAAAQGRAFRFSHSMRVDLRRVSFAGAAAPLAQVMAAVAPDLAAWPAMRGFALHGLADLDPTAAASPVGHYGDGP